MIAAYVLAPLLAVALVVLALVVTREPPSESEQSAATVADAQAKPRRQAHETIEQYASRVERVARAHLAELEPREEAHSVERRSNRTASAAHG